MDAERRQQPTHCGPPLTEGECVLPMLPASIEGVCRWKRSAGSVQHSLVAFLRHRSNSSAASGWKAECAVALDGTTVEQRRNRTRRLDGATTSQKDTDASAEVEHLRQIHECLKNTALPRDLNSAKLLFALYLR